MGAMSTYCLRACSPTLLWISSGFPVPVPGRPRSPGIPALPTRLRCLTFPRVLESWLHDEDSFVSYLLKCPNRVALPLAGTNEGTAAS